MNMEHWWNDSESGKLKYSKKTCPEPLCSPKIPHVLHCN